MALSSTHRSSLHRSLAPVVGQAEAEALLDQFPARAEDDPATAGFVREQISVSNAQLRAEIATLRIELHEEIWKLRAEMHSLIRRQTIWMASLVLTSMAVNAAVVAALT
ncbi:MAG: hypothetical protein KDA98_08570 [Acidimicrobiales bacterium]|nr:hypothetical protein [Acidimicrobiales bacterium]